MSTPEEAVSPENWREVTVRTGRNLWSIHGMTHRVLDALGIVHSKAQALADRGPDPDYAAESEFERGMRAGARLQPPTNYGGVNNGGGSKLGWLITLNIMITLAVSGWVVKTIIDYGNRLVRIECRMDPQCVSVVPVVPRAQP